MPDALQQAMALLPHGASFRFIQTLVSLEPGQAAVGEYTVSGTEWFLEGHFPNEPLFPGVLLVEAAAQLAGIAAQTDPNTPPFAKLKLTGLRNVKILGTARPGEVIRYQAAIVARFGNMLQARARAWVGQTEILQAEIVLAGE